MDYFDIYSPVTSISSIRVLIYKLLVHQMYVKTTFLNEDLNEEICMDQYKGY